MDFTTLTIQDIEQQLVDIKSKEAELKRLLVIRREEQKAEIAKQIRRLIAESGYEIAEIVPLLETKPLNGEDVVAVQAGEHQSIRYIDPQNPQNVYVSGALPSWMKTQMAEQGYDPASNDDRVAFKSNYLQAVAD